MRVFVFLRNRYEGGWHNWRQQTRVKKMDDERFKDPYTEDWIPKPPTHAPLPMSDAVIY